MQKYFLYLIKRPNVLDSTFLPLLKAFISLYQPPVFATKVTTPSSTKMAAPSRATLTYWCCVLVQLGHVSKNQQIWIRQLWIINWTLQTFTSSYLIRNIIHDIIKELNVGPWWWSSGQRARLLLRQSEFESRWGLHFFCKIVIEKHENKQKEAEVGPFFFKKRNWTSY